MSKGARGSDLSIWNSSERPYNPLLRVFTQIDLSFVVRIALSLFALLLMFDSFSGEREGGTLPMVLACPVRRLEVLAGIVYGRELREHLMSFRFGTVFALTQLLMVTAVLVFSTEHDTAMAEYEPVSGLVDDEGLVNLRDI